MTSMARRLDCDVSGWCARRCRGTVAELEAPVTDGLICFDLHKTAGKRIAVGLDQTDNRRSNSGVFHVGIWSRHGDCLMSR
jgi:hypothetical protein